MLTTRRFFLAIVAIAGLALAPCAQGAIFYVGDACAFTTVQAAIDHAATIPGPDVIRIVRNQSYTQQALTISTDDDLSLLGGWDDCTDDSADGRTTLDGSGPPAASVLTISGTGLVQLRFLEIRGGDSASHGGGISYSGTRGTLQVLDTVVTQNAANFGGGIAATGPELDAPDADPEGNEGILRIGPNVFISNNEAGVGGGIYASLMFVDMSAADQSTIFFNHALDGGGIALSSARADIGSGSAFGVVFANVAEHAGGGLLAIGGSDVRIFTTLADTPVNFNLNSALYGGAISVAGNDPEATTRVTLFDAVIDNNAAAIGGAFHLDSGADSNFGVLCMRDVIHASFGPCSIPRPDRAVACDAGQRCNRVSRNESPSGGDQKGAAAYAEGAHAFLAFDGTRIEDNRGTTILQREAPPDVLGTGITLANCLISGNDSQKGPLFYSSGFAETRINGCTIAGNPFLASYTLGSNYVVRLTETIVWQPGKLTYHNPDSTVMRAIANMVLSQETDSLDFAPGTVITDDPRFVDAANGDYHLLAPDSPAIDFSDLTDEGAFDLEGAPRGRDREDAPDEFGPRDLGAFEAAPLDCLFENGFDFTMRPAGLTCVGPLAALR